MFLSPFEYRNAPEFFYSAAQSHISINSVWSKRATLFGLLILAASGSGIQKVTPKQGSSFTLLGNVVMATSKLQEETKERLRTLLKGYDFKENYRPKWLRNPETGYPLEIDIWLPDVKIGIEVQGRQHYEFIPFFHSSEEEFKKQLQRDELKRELCKTNGVRLYEIYTIQDIDGFLEAVRAHHPEMARELTKKNTAIKSLSFLSAELFRESKKKAPIQTKLTSLTKKITHICDKYNIPFQDIKPDFEMTKVDISFGTKRIIKAELVISKTSKILYESKFAVMTVQDGIIYLRKHNKKKNEQYLDIQIDLKTGVQVNSKKKTFWRLSEETLYVVHPDNQ